MALVTKETTTPRTREQRTILAVAVLASFVTFLDGTVVSVALPAISAELGGGLTVQQWVVDAYLISLGALILVAGSLSDLYGRLRIMRLGLVGFGITSVLVAVAPTAAVLVVARGLQGVAGALLVPSSLALITSTFRDAAQARAIGSWTAWTSGAVLAGPVVGGLFVDLLSWRLAFAVNVIPVAVTLSLMTRLQTRDVRLTGARVDYPSTVLAVVGLGGPVVALIEHERLGWGHPAIWLPLTVGLLAAAGFLVRQRVAAQPMLPLDLFRVRNFSWGNAATILVYGALSLSGFVIVVFLQEHAGYSATEAGLATIPSTVVLIALSSTVGRWSGTLGPRVFMTVGPVVAGAGFLLLLGVGDDVGYWTQVLPGILVFGLGLTLTVAPLTSAILGAIDASRSGIASAVNNAVARVAGLVAVALLGVVTGGALDLEGFRRGRIASAALMALGGLVAWVGIRRPGR